MPLNLSSLVLVCPSWSIKLANFFLVFLVCYSKALLCSSRSITFRSALHSVAKGQLLLVGFTQIFFKRCGLFLHPHQSSQKIVVRPSRAAQVESCQRPYPLSFCRHIILKLIGAMGLSLYSLVQAIFARLHLLRTLACQTLLILS